MDVEKSQRRFQFFSALRFFPEIFFSIFSCFATEWIVKNIKGSPLSVFRHYETFFSIFSLQRVPLSVFRHCETFIRKFVFSPKGSPFNCDKNVDNFGSVPLLARQGLALAGPGAPLGPFFFQLFSKNFRFSSTVKEYLTLGSFCAIFEPWIWRRLGPVPACYVFCLGRKLTSSLFINFLSRYHDYG